MELDVLKKVLIEILSVDVSEIHMDTTFMGDLGADSLDIYQIVMRLEEELQIVFTEEDVREIETVGQAVTLIQKMEKAKADEE